MRKPTFRRGPGAAGPITAVWLVDALYRNGAVLLSLQLVRRLSQQGSRLAVLQRLPAGDEVVVPSEVDLVELTNGRRSFRWSVLPATGKLVSLARRADVVVNCSEIGKGLVVSWLAARLTRRPLVVAVHADLDSALEEWMPARLHPLFHWLHRRVDGAICVSPALVDPLVRNGLDRERIRVVRNGIDIAAVTAAAAAEPVGAEPSDVPVVVVTGRVAHQKGYDVLVRAHAEVVEEHPHRIQIHNSGRPADLAALRALIAELGVGASVRFVDPLHSPLPHVARADVFCLPSRHEGLPLSLLEAVALSVPCIATDCSDGVRSALDGGRVGDLVAVDDVTALAQALRDYLTDPGPLRAKADGGPAHALLFDVDVMTRAWTTALTELTRR